MTEDSAVHPAAGGYGPLVLRVGLGALLLTAVWLVVSFFLGAASASAAEPPAPTAPTGPLSSAVHAADALSAGLDRVASDTLAAAGLPVRAVPTRSTAAAASPSPTRAAVPTAVPAPNRVVPAAPAAHSTPAAAAIAVVQQVSGALSEAASPVLQSPIVAPVDAVTDVASGLVAATTAATDPLLPTLSQDLIDPVAGTVQQLLGTSVGVPVRDLPGGASDSAAGSWPPNRTVAREPVSASGISDAVRGPAVARSSLARGALVGTHPVFLGGSRGPGSVPQPPSPPGAPTGVAAGSDAAASPTAGPGGIADLSRIGFTPSTVLTSSDGRAGGTVPGSPTYDFDSTPD